MGPMEILMDNDAVATAGTGRVSSDEIRKRIMTAMPDAQCQVYDLTGGGDHYQVEVISEAFVGLNAVKRHRLVYDTLRDVLGGALHALALTTRAPNE